MPNVNHHFVRPGTWYRRYKNQGSTTVVSDSQSPVNGQFGRYVRSSTNTPGFNNWTDLGKRLPMRAFSYEEERVENWEGYEQSKTTSLPKTHINCSWYEVEGRLFRTFDTTPITIDAFTPASKLAADAEARNKVLLKLKDQSINLAQMYAERKQTERLLLDTLGRLVKAALALKKGDFVKAANALGVKARKRAQRRYNRAYREAHRRHPKNLAAAQSEALASGWLQTQYGWMPLLNDVYGSCEVLAKTSGTPLRGIAIASKTLHHDPSGFATVNLLGGTQRTIKGMHKYTIKYTVHYTVQNYGLKKLSELGITNPLLIAWELVPFSFVVDWFLPIGNWLSTLDATLGLTFDRGCKTVFQKREGTMHMFQSNVALGSETRSMSYRFSSTVVLVQRTVLTDFPTTGRPVFKNPVSTIHVANAMALLTTTFRK